MGKDLDSLIKEAYVEYFDEAGYPPSSEVWEKTVKELKRKRRAERRKHVRPMIAVFFMIVTITGALAVFNRPVMAFTNRFMKTIIEVTENTFRIHKKIVPIEDKDKEDYFFGRNKEDWGSTEEDPFYTVDTGIHSGWVCAKQCGCAEQKRRQGNGHDALYQAGGEW